MNKIAVQLAEGFEEIEAISIIDVLRRAGIDVTVISITRQLEVTGAHAIKIIADQIFEETNFKDFDMIVLPGGMPGALNLQNHKGLQGLRAASPRSTICERVLFMARLKEYGSVTRLCSTRPVPWT